MRRLTASGVWGIILLVSAFTQYLSFQFFSRTHDMERERYYQELRRSNSESGAREPGVSSGDVQALNDAIFFSEASDHMVMGLTCRRFLKCQKWFLVQGAIGGLLLAVSASLARLRKKSSVGCP